MSDSESSDLKELSDYDDESGENEMNDEFGESAEQEISEGAALQDEEGAEFEAGSFEREEGS